MCRCCSWDTTTRFSSYGLQEFAAACADAGVDGLIVPDLPPEESDPLLDACRTNGLNLIYLIAPTSTPERVDAVIERASGFIYLVALTGVTGARSDLAANLADYIARVRRKTDLPLAIGFGISTRAHVEQVEHLVDGVICASALLNKLDGVASEDLPRVAREFVEEFRGGKSPTRHGECRKDHDRLPGHSGGDDRRAEHRRGHLEATEELLRSIMHYNELQVGRFGQHDLHDDDRS